MILSPETCLIEVKESNKTQLPEDLHFISQNLLVVGDNHTNLENKQKWINESSLLPEGFTFHEMILLNSYDKKEALAELETFLRKHNYNSRLEGLIITTADELITNAFFDAPKEAGKVIFHNTPRSQNISSRPVKVIIGQNHNEIAVSVIDYFGSIEVPKLTSHLQKTFNKKEYQAPQGEGAGIGLSLCIKRNVSLLIKFKENTYSQFTAFFPKVDNYKEYLEKSQILGIFNEK